MLNVVSECPTPQPLAGPPPTDIQWAQAKAKGSFAAGGSADWRV